MKEYNLYVLKKQLEDQKYNEIQQNIIDHEQLFSRQANSQTGISHSLSQGFQSFTQQSTQRNASKFKESQKIKSNDQFIGNEKSIVIEDQTNQRKNLRLVKASSQKSFRNSIYKFPEQSTPNFQENFDIVCGTSSLVKDSTRQSTDQKVLKVKAQTELIDKKRLTQQAFENINNITGWESEEELKKFSIDARNASNKQKSQTVKKFKKQKKVSNNEESINDKEREYYNSVIVQMKEKQNSVQRSPLKLVLVQMQEQNPVNNLHQNYSLLQDQKQIPLTDKNRKISVEFHASRTQFDFNFIKSPKRQLKEILLTTIDVSEPKTFPSKKLLNHSSNFAENPKRLKDDPSQIDIEQGINEDFYIKKLLPTINTPNSNSLNKLNFQEYVKSLKKSQILNPTPRQSQYQNEKMIQSQSLPQIQTHQQTNLYNQLKRIISFNLIHHEYTLFFNKKPNKSLKHLLFETALIQLIKQQLEKTKKIERILNKKGEVYVSQNQWQQS